MSRWKSRVAGVALTVVASLAVLPPGAAATDFILPRDLQVDGGEEAWHADNLFRLHWENPAPIGAVHYRVRDEADTVVVGDTRIGWETDRIDNLRVPGTPGAYTAEVWLEDGAGNQGPPATVKLRFDDLRPAQAEPLPSPGWIGRTELPHTVRLGHPAGQPPVSGIRGYAVSVDRAPDGDPCAAPDRCTEAETDLRGGAGDDLLQIAELPEGTSYVHTVAVSGSGMRSAVPGHAVLHVDKTDPVTRLAGVPGGWTNRAVALTASATDAASGMEPDGEGGSPFTAIRVDGGAAAIAAGDSVGTTVIAAGVHTVAYYARDAAGNVNDGGGGNGQPNRPPSTAVVRIDRDAPSIAFANSQSPRDPELIEARVTDPLSGPDPSRGRIAVRRAGSGDRFEPLPAETGGGRLRARWDSDSYPAGEYEFRATGYDAAGNAVATERRANGSRMVLPSPLKTPTALRAGFGGRVLVWHRCVRRGGKRRCRRQTVRGFARRPAARLLPHGRGTLFSGRLVAGLRTPLAGMPVQVIEHFDAGAGQPERVSTVKTGADGVFTARLAPGPSRKVVAIFRGTRALTRSGSRRIRLGVRGGLRMRASAAVAAVGGRPVVFRGRVAAAAGAIPPGGKSVQLQFRLPGIPWTEFRTIETDRRGRFRYAYRFSDDDSRGVRFQFRAFAPAQSGWPFEPAGSRPVAVRGR